MKIRVIRPGSKQNTDPEFMAHSSRMTERYASPGTLIETVFLDAGAHGGPMTGHINEARVMSSARYVVEEVIRAEREGFDAVYLSGEYDVGAEISRHIVDIPVVDTGTTAMRFANLLGDRIGLLVVEDSLLSYTRKLLRRWGVTESVVAMRTWNIPLSELWPRRAEVRDMTLAICRDAIAKDSVNVIVPFCTVFMPFIFDPKELEDAIGMPVVDTVGVGLKTTEMFVQLGVRPNRVVYPKTPAAVWTSR